MNLFELKQEIDRLCADWWQYTPTNVEEIKNENNAGGRMIRLVTIGSSAVEEDLRLRIERLEHENSRLQDRIDFLTGDGRYERLDR